MTAIPLETVEKWHYWRGQVQYHQHLVQSYLASYHELNNEVRWRCLIKAHAHAQCQEHAENMARLCAQGDATDVLLIQRGGAR